MSQFLNVFTDTLISSFFFLFSKNTNTEHSVFQKRRRSQRLHGHPLDSPSGWGGGGGGASSLSDIGGDDVSVMSETEGR